MPGKTTPFAHLQRQRHTTPSSTAPPPREVRHILMQHHGAASKSPTNPNGSSRTRGPGRRCRCHGTGQDRRQTQPSAPKMTTAAVGSWTPPPPGSRTNHDRRSHQNRRPPPPPPTGVRPCRATSGSGQDGAGSGGTPLRRRRERQ
jgi:hypothetical protein